MDESSTIIQALEENQKTYDELISQAGGFGTYQKRFVFFFTLLQLYLGFLLYNISLL